MSFWTHAVFPRLCHWTLRGETAAAERRAVLAGVSGEVLELGFGTGLNLEHYPAGPGGVTALVGLEPNPGMVRLAGPAVAAARFPVELAVERAEELPFAGGRFDRVVATFTLCSVAEPMRALSEVRRVLAPGGRLVFLEHGLADEPRVARWQRRLTPIQRRLADGCHLDRDIVALIERAGLVIERLDRHYMKGTPRFGGHLYAGEAAPG